MPVAPNLLARDFSAQRPDERWVTDITYVWTQTGWAYLAATLDLFSRSSSAGRSVPPCRCALSMRRFRNAVPPQVSFIFPIAAFSTPATTTGLRWLSWTSP